MSTPLLRVSRLLGLTAWREAAPRVGLVPLLVGTWGRGRAAGARPGSRSPAPRQWRVLGSSVKSPSSPWRPGRWALSPQNLPPDKIFHVIVAPCYDKKLEALREDFSPALHSYRGADCVLTSGEQYVV